MCPGEPKGAIGQKNRNNGKSGVGGSTVLPLSIMSVRLGSRKSSFPTFPLLWQVLNFPVEDARDPLAGPVTSFKPVTLLIVNVRVLKIVSPRAINSRRA